MLLRPTSLIHPRPTDASLLTLDRIFSSPQFDQETIGLFKWHQDGTAYFTLEATANNQAGKDLVCHDLVSGQRQVIAPAPWFIPPGATTPLPVEDFAPPSTRAAASVHEQQTCLASQHPWGLLGLELPSGNLRSWVAMPPPRR